MKSNKEIKIHQDLDAWIMDSTTPLSIYLDIERREVTLRDQAIKEPEGVTLSLSEFASIYRQVSDLLPF